ncbi:MAG: ribonuclease D [Terrimicrobiaceae bacterium]
MISEPGSLAELISRIEPCSQIALDTEADSLHSYFEKLCLIQLSSREEHVLIDPLAQLDLQPLFDALAKKRIVFHGADYDMRLLNRTLNVQFEDMFDTMIASRLCGLKELGLAALVEKYFHVKLSKASQKANWALRPLSDQMVEYAMNDTRYLLDLGEILDAELRRLGRWEWFVQSRDRMIASARETRARDENKAWRISGSAALSTRAQSVLRILWQWRDSEAQAWDRPAFHVLGNEDLLRICEKCVQGEAFSTPRMSSRRRKSFEVVLALALQIPESEWPTQEKVRRKRPSREQMARLDHIRAVRDRAAKELDLDPSIVAPRQALEAAAEDPNTDVLMPWQRQLLHLAPREEARPVAI